MTVAELKQWLEENATDDMEVKCLSKNEGKWGDYVDWKILSVDCLEVFKNIIYIGEE